MKVDTKPFPQANVVELLDFTPTGQNFSFQINMVGPMRRHDKQRREAASGKRPQDRRELEQQHVTEEQVRHIRNQLPASNRLLEKYQYLVQWDGDEVEVVLADDSSEVSLADMHAWDAEGQEPISGVALEDCDRIEATKTD